MDVKRYAPPRIRRKAGQARRRARELQAGRDLEERLVWVLGSPRSGSTWLLQLLGEHSAVVPVNEPQIGLYLGPFLSDLPGWNTASLDTDNFTLRRIQRNKRDQFFSSQFSDVWLPSLRQMMLKRFQAQAARYPARGVSASKSLVVIKEPNGSQSADVIMAALPRSRFLFLLRDGRDVVDSELAANQKGSWVSREFPGGGGIGDGEQRLAFVVQSALKWLWRTEVTERAFEAHPGPKLLVRYEELRRDTETQLRAVLEWMGIGVPATELSALIARHQFERLPAESRGPQHFHRAATPGMWQENLTAEEQGALQRVIGDKLRQLGYAD